MGALVNEGVQTMEAGWIILECVLRSRLQAEKEAKQNDGKQCCSLRRGSSHPAVSGWVECSIIHSTS